MEGLGQSNRKLAIFAYQQLPPSSLGGLLGCWVPQGRPGWMLRGESKAGAVLQWKLGVSVSLPFWYWHGFVHLFVRTVFVHHLYN